MYVVSIVHDDYAMLTPNQLNEASLQLLSVYFLSTLFDISIPKDYTDIKQNTS